ncbi:MAG: 30S ribosomal protein S5 [Patescibacteria group bacterium]
MQRQKSEFDQKTLDIRRVARTMAGGRRFSFRVTIALGDRKGGVGVGTAKGLDVAASIEKAIQQAKKNITKITTHNGTIPHTVTMKFRSARVLLKPAKPGTGIIAGGAVRVICELAGIKNITGKIEGRSSNKINVSEATIAALKSLKPRKQKAVVAAGAPAAQTEVITAQ